MDINSRHIQKGNEKTRYLLNGPPPNTAHEETFDAEVAFSVLNPLSLLKTKIPESKSFLPVN